MPPPDRARLDDYHHDSERGQLRLRCGGKGRVAGRGPSGGQGGIPGENRTEYAGGGANRPICPLRAGRMAKPTLARLEDCPVSPISADKLAKERGRAPRIAKSSAGGRCGCPNTRSAGRRHGVPKPGNAGRRRGEGAPARAHPQPQPQPEPEPEPEPEPDRSPLNASANAPARAPALHPGTSVAFPCPSPHMEIR